MPCQYSCLCGHTFMCKCVHVRELYCKVRTGRLHNEEAQRDGNAEEERQKVNEVTSSFQ